MSQNLKKILLISSYAPPAIGGPQNMYNLMRDFPVDTYCILTSYYNIDDFSAKEGWWLEGKYFFYDKPQAQKEDRKKEALEEKNNIGNILQKFKFLVKRSALVRVIAGFPIIFSQIIAIIKQGKKILKEQSIDIMVGFSDYGPALLATYFLHILTRKPYMLFMFDIYKGNALPFPGGILARIFEKRILRHAENIIVTNDGTRDFYTARYGKELEKNITVIYNAVFPEKYTIEDITLTPPQEKKTVLFTGRIYWPQIGALKNLIAAVETIEGDDIKVEIYTPSPRDYLGKIGITESEKVSIGVARPEDIPGIQQQADILFLPLSWNTGSDDIINTATPGKLTDYLISGKPMLIHAPATSYVIQYAQAYNFASCVGENSVRQLQKALLEICNNPEETVQKIKNARDTFWKNHDANKNHLVFKSLFEKNSLN